MELGAIILVKYFLTHNQGTIMYEFLPFLIYYCCRQGLILHVYYV
jgi:hypothetical protein